MSTLHIMVGIPGSGKSTYSERLAKEIGATRVSLDELMESMRKGGGRAMMMGGGRGREMAMQRIGEAILQGDVVYDFTNVHERDWRRYMECCPHGTKFKLYWFDISPDEAMRRQELRTRKVPEPVLRMMWMAMNAAKKRIAANFSSGDVTYITVDDWVENI